ncbi:MAG: hypothetical protein ACLGGX_01620 [Bdellovibrionia bacterium]
MKKLIFILILIAFPQIVYSQDVLLPLGGSKLFAVKGAGRIWIADRKVISGSKFSNQLFIKSRKIGSSDLVIGKERYRVHVMQPEQLEKFSTVQQWCQKRLDLRADLKDGLIRIVGKLHSFEQWKELQQMLAPEPWIFAASMPEITKRKLLSAIKEQLENHNLSFIFIQTQGDWRVHLNNKDSNLALYKSILPGYGIRIFEEKNAITSEPLIRVKVTVAEIKREFTQKYGIVWPSSLQAQVLPNTIRGSSESLDISALAIENSGVGKVLASPNLLVKSGEEAEFNAGGEFPIKVLHHRIETVEWKKYGIHLKIKPRSDSAGRMQIEIDTRVSNVDFSKEINDIPALTHHNVKSHFTLNKSATVVLSGLIRNEDAKTLQGIPLLNRIPVLGALFGSQDFKENRSELVIFVKPEIVYEQFENSNEHLGVIK